MCHSRFYHGPGASVSVEGVSPSGDSGQGFLAFPLPESPHSGKEAPAHFHVLENGSIWKFRDKQGRFCKPYRQRVKVCVVCEEIWENHEKGELE